MIAAETIVAQALPCAQLSAGQRADLFALLGRYFEGVTPDQFNADLAGKNHVILLERGDKLVGFSTLLAYETTFAGDPVSVIYSGDTIVAPDAWNSPVLARAWITTVKQLRGQYPRGRYYWLLLTSGFRTYRFLPVFWREFFPRFDQPVSPRLQPLLDHLARAQFGTAYDPVGGLVRFAQPQRLRGELAALPAGRTADPHVNFFLTRNPGHARGDELVCLAELDDANLTPAGRRMVGRPTA
jgi:hypothetical protein